MPPRALYGVAISHHNIIQGFILRSHNHKLAVLALAALTTLPALAADGFSPVLGATLTGGGEKLARVDYTDGNSQTIKSGGLIHLFGGFEYQAGSFAVQANAGYHVDDTTAKNGSVKFSRWPVEVLGFWQVADHVRLGGGLRKTGSAKLSSSGAASGVGGLTLQGGMGAVLQGEYLFGAGRYGAHGRFVSEKYKVDGKSVSGNHVGAGVSVRF
jgi:hypothetical protein